jgi:hypothetical protein
MTDKGHSEEIALVGDACQRWQYSRLLCINLVYVLHDIDFATNIKYHITHFARIRKSIRRSKLYKSY